GDVAEHRPDAICRLGTPGSNQRLELLARSLPHEHVDLAVALEQPLHEMASDEPGRPGNEVSHLRRTATSRRASRRSPLDASSPPSWRACACRAAIGSA